MKSKDRKIVNDVVISATHREIVDAEYWEESEPAEAVPDTLPETTMDAATDIVSTQFDSDPVASLVTDETLYRAAVAGNRGQVVAGLSTLTNHTHAEIEFLLKQQKPKVVTALCWAAGLRAATAFHVQVKTAGIVPRLAIAPKGDGYTLAVPALEWYRDFYERLLLDSVVTRY